MVEKRAIDTKLLAIMVDYASVMPADAYIDPKQIMITNDPHPSSRMKSIYELRRRTLNT
ncbi:hypothetical protein P4S68_11395 [Pseudoalteromonas sp. Hal099]